MGQTETCKKGVANPNLCFLLVKNHKTKQNTKPHIWMNFLFIFSSEAGEYRWMEKQLDWCQLSLKALEYLYDHKINRVGGELRSFLVQNLALNRGSPEVRLNCSGLYPGSFWKLSRVETLFFLDWWDFGCSMRAHEVLSAIVFIWKHQERAVELCHFYSLLSRVRARHLTVRKALSVWGKVKSRVLLSVSFQQLFFLRQKQYHAVCLEPDMASRFRSPKAEGSDFRGETEAMGPFDETERKTILGIDH